MKRILFALFCMTFLVAGSYPIVKFRAQDDSGNALSGAKLLSYEDGTTTPLATYSDQALSSANANPVVADSSGWFGEIYMDPDEGYKFKLTTSADVEIWTIDDVYATQLTNSSVVTRLKQVASNPLDYRDSVGDGAADEYLAVQDAIDNRTLVVDLVGKTFRCDSALTLGSNIIMQNGTLDFTNSTDNNFIAFNGNQSTAYSLSANGDPGDVQITAALCNNWAAGDWLYVYSSANWTGTDLSGEIVQIESIAACVAQLANPLQGEYLTANSAVAREYNPITNVTFRDMTIQASPTQSGTGRVIFGEIAENIVLDNVRFEGIKDAGFECHACWNVRVEKSLFETDDGSGMGINIAAASRDWVVTGNQFSQLDTGVDVGEVNSTYNDGVVRWVQIKDNKFYGNEIGVDLLATTQHMSVTDNYIFSDVATSSDIGIQSKGVDANISGNMIRFAGYGIAVDHDVAAMTGMHQHLRIDNNTIQESQLNAIRATQFSAAIHGVSINGNISQEHVGTTSTNAAIYLNSTVAVENLSISNNIVETDTVDVRGIFCNTGASTVGIDVSGNRLTLPGASRGIDLQNDTAAADTIGVTVNDNIFMGSATAVTGFHIRACTNLSVSGNVIRDALEGIELYGVIDTATISNNSLHGTKTGIHIDAVTADFEGIAIDGNTVEGCNAASNHCIFFERGVKDASITDNVLIRDDDTDDNIQLLNNDGAGDTDNIIISGNFIKNGAQGIGEPADANVTDVQAFNNVFESCTSNIEGTVIAEIWNSTPANLDATCTTGEWKIDNNATDEMCYCYTTDTLYCWTIDDTTGPAD